MEAVGKSFKRKPSGTGLEQQNSAAQNALFDKQIEAIKEEGQNASTHDSIQELRAKLDEARSKHSTIDYQKRKMAQLIADSAAYEHTFLACAAALQRDTGSKGDRFWSQRTLRNMARDADHTAKPKIVSTALKMFELASTLAPPHAPDATEGAAEQQQAEEEAVAEADKWQLVHAAAVLILAMVSRRTKRSQVRGQNRLEKLEQLFLPVCEQVRDNGGLAMLVQHSWSEMDFAAESPEAQQLLEQDRLHVSDFKRPWSAAQDCVHHTLRELCRNTIIRDELQRQELPSFRCLLAILRTREEERWVEREKNGTANTAMVPHHWALSNLKKALDRREGAGQEKISDRRRREIYRVLVRCLHHREMHLDVMHVISSHCVSQLNLDLDECLTLLKQGEYLKKLRKLTRFHTPLQKLAQLHMPVLSIQEMGYIFGEIPDLASRGFRMCKEIERYANLAKHDGHECEAEEKLNALATTLVLRYIPEFLHGMATFFRDFTATEYETDPTTGQKRPYNVTIRGLNTAVARRNFFLYLRHKHSNRAEAFATRYRLTLWELLVAPAVYFPVLRQLCDKIEAQCAFPEISEAQQVHVQNIFNHFDINGNGKLDKEEVWQIISAQHEQQGVLHTALTELGFSPRPVNQRQRQAFERNFKMVDLDGSEALDFKEFLFIIAPHLVDDAKKRKQAASAADKAARAFSAAGDKEKAAQLQKVAQAAGGADGKAHVDTSMGAVTSAVDTHFNMTEEEAEQFQADQASKTLEKTKGAQVSRLKQMTTKSSHDSGRKPIGPGASNRVGKLFEAGRGDKALDNVLEFKELVNRIAEIAQSEWEKANELAELFEMESGTGLCFSTNRKQPLAWVYAKAYEADKWGDYHGKWVYFYKPSQSEVAKWLDRQGRLGDMVAGLMFVATLPFFWRSWDMLKMLSIIDNPLKLERLMEREVESIAFEAKDSNQATPDARLALEGRQERLVNSNMVDSAVVAAAGVTDGSDSGGLLSANVAERNRSGTTITSSYDRHDEPKGEEHRIYVRQAKTGNVRNSTRRTWRSVVEFNFQAAMLDTFELFGFKAIANVFDSQYVGWAGAGWFVLMPFIIYLLLFLAYNSHIGTDSNSFMIAFTLALFIGGGMCLTARAFILLWRSRHKTSMSKTDVDHTHITWWEPKPPSSTEPGMFSRFCDRIVAAVATFVGIPPPDTASQIVWSNVFEWFGAVAEFVQFASFSFVAVIPWPDLPYLRGIFDWAVFDFSGYLKGADASRTTFILLVAMLGFWVLCQLYFEKVVVAKGIALKDRDAELQEQRQANAALERASTQTSLEATRAAMAAQQRQQNNSATSAAAAYMKGVVGDIQQQAGKRFDLVFDNAAAHRERVKEWSELFAAYVLPMTTTFFYLSIIVSIFSIFDCTGYGGSCKQCDGANGGYVCSKSAAALKPGVICNTTAPGLVFQARDDLCAPYGCFTDESKRCFQGAHLSYTLIALVGFGLYFPSATLTPFQIYFVDPKRDIRYPPMYVMGMQFAKALMAAFGTLLTAYWLVPLLALVIISTYVSYANFVWTVSNVMAMNHFKGTTFLMIAYSGVCAILTKLLHDEDAVSQSNGSLVALLVGWTVIPIVSFCAWKGWLLFDAEKVGQHRPHHFTQEYNTAVDDDTTDHSHGERSHARGRDREAERKRDTKNGALSQDHAPNPLVINNSPQL
eukprot:g2210.t1